MGVPREKVNLNAGFEKDYLFTATERDAVLNILNYDTML